MKLLSLSVFLVCAIHFFSGFSPAQDKNWREITAEERQLSSPKVEADADAEVIFWEVRIADDYVPRAGFKTILNHYIRIKIFTERGREKNSKVDITFGKISDLGVNVVVRDIAARTIKPDGTIVELKPQDVFDRDTVKGKDLKLKAKSFAVPGIETGAIVEYRWKEVRSDALSNYIRLELARNIPVQFVKYYVKPVTAPNFTWGMRVHSINTQSNFVKEKDGFYSTTMTNVPAFKEETLMPPENEIRPWVLVYYADDDERKTSWQEYWRDTGRRTYKYHAEDLKANDNVHRAAAEVVGGANDSVEKIRRIFDYCRKNIKNIEDDASALTPDQRKSIKDNKSVSDTLNRRTGSWHDINMLFAAMAAAAGFDVRVANVSLRSDASFNKTLTNDYFVRTENIAVKIGNEWKFFDPGSLYTPFGMLFWSEEGQEALISDASEPIWVKTPSSTAEQSKQKRIARLRLNDDGSIEGDIRIEYTGHWSAAKKEFNDDLSQKEREDALTEMIRKDILSTAEISNISVENVQDPDKPFAYSFKLHVPAYADRTGRRLFFRPNIFERNTNALFVESVRKQKIFFDYPRSEDDDITIELPTGFSMESAGSPSAIRDAKGIASHDTKIVLSDDRKLLTYQRKFSFGRSDSLQFGVDAYPRIKQLFEDFHRAEAHVIALRQN